MDCEEIARLAAEYDVAATNFSAVVRGSLDNNALVQPQSRQAFARLVSQGWTDALRRLHLEGLLWTFWHCERERWTANKGMRLDHFVVSPTMCDRLVDGCVDRGVRSEENASDHAPAWIVLEL